MNIFILFLLIILSCVAGVSYMAYYYGLRGSGLVITSLGLVIMLPIIIITSSRFITDRIIKKNGYKKRQRISLFLKVLWMFIVVTPIGLNDAFNDSIASLSTTPVKRKTRFSIAKEKLTNALMKTASAYVYSN